MIVLPFPSSILSGHSEHIKWAKSAATKKHRADAKAKTEGSLPAIPQHGDIRIHVRFVPPDRRGDRVNFPNRMKPYFDGIADALGVNDARFLPSYEFAAPEKPGRVEVFIHKTVREGLGGNALHRGATYPQGGGSDASANSTSEPDHDAIEVRND